MVLLERLRSQLRIRRSDKALEFVKSGTFVGNLTAECKLLTNQ